MNRRIFLAVMASSLVGLPLNTLAERRSAPTAAPSFDEPWLTIGEVQEHLFPADETSPGAYDIAALNYLHNMIHAPDISSEERDLIKNGAGWLNDLSMQVYQLKFIKLNETQRESILRKIEQSRAGSRWLSLLMDYLIEALLSDPVYGGNKNGAGWKWLQHQAGFPQPGPDKKYFNLGHIVNRRTKA